MSRFPMFVNIDRHRMFDDEDFGFGLSPKTFFEVTPRRRFCDPHWQHSHHQQQSHPQKEQHSPLKEEDTFQVHFDVGEYVPEELSVKTVDNVVVVEGKHEEKDDGGHCSVSRQFQRKYPIPAGFDAESVKSSLSADGKRLTVKGNKAKANES